MSAVLCLLRSKLFLGLGALIIASFMLLYVKGLKADLASSELLNAGYKLQNAALNYTVDQNLKALKISEVEKERLAAETENLKAEIGVIIENDNASKAWASSPIPSGLLDRLRK